VDLHTAVSLVLVGPSAFIPLEVNLLLTVAYAVRIVLAKLDLLLRVVVVICMVQVA
jgi:hypothetical protein